MKNHQILLVLSVLVAGVLLWLYGETGPDPAASRADVSVAMEVSSRHAKMTLPADRREAPVSELSGIDIMDVVVAVESEEGHPIDSAHIVLSELNSGERMEAVRQVDRHGHYIAHPRQGSSWVICASAPGRENVLQEVSIDRSATFKIVMQAAGIIRGRVTLTDGSAPPASVAVIALKEGIRRNWMHLGIKGSIKWPMAFTDDSGTFEIQGLRSGAEYALLCGGMGWVARAPEMAIAADGKDQVVIELWRGYGCHIKLNAEGSVIPPSSRARCVTDAKTSDGACFLAPDSWEEDMVRIGCNWAGTNRGSYDWRERLLVARAPFSKPALDDCEISYFAPGFEDCIARVPLMALRPDSIAIATVSVRPIVAGFGSVTIKCNMDYRLECPAGDCISCTTVARIVALDGNNESFEVGIPRPSNGPVTVAGIPIGRYSISLESVDGSWIEHAVGLPFVAVAAGGAGSATFDLKGYGCLDIDVMDSRGQATQATTIEVRRSDGKKLVQMFSRPPYIVECIPVGDYEVLARRAGPSGDGDAVSRSSSVYVSPGAVAPVTLRLELK